MSRETSHTAAFAPSVRRIRGRVSGSPETALRRSAALAMAVSLMPAVASAGGFWSMSGDGGGERARTSPPASAESAPPPTIAATNAAFGTADNARFVTLPRFSRKLGLEVSRGDGRPKVSGLAYQATPYMRIAADGDIDLEDGTVSGGFKVKIDF